MVISMAPELSSVVVFEAPQGNMANWNDLLNKMATSNHIKQFSSSWGYRGMKNETTDNIFREMALHVGSHFSKLRGTEMLGSALFGCLLIALT